MADEVEALAALDAVGSSSGRLAGARRSPALGFLAEAPPVPGRPAQYDDDLDRPMATS